jgi:hypothetical protein
MYQIGFTTAPNQGVSILGSDPIRPAIEIRPFRNGRRVYESVVMQPVFLGQEQAIDYAKGRACFGSGEIRMLD